MKQPVTYVLSIALPLLGATTMLACGDKGQDSGGGDVGGDGGIDATSELIYTDANNYAYTAELTLDTIPVQEGADATIDWSGLTVDMRGRSITATDVDQVFLVAFNISKEDVLTKITANSLLQSDIRDYRQFLNEEGSSSADFSEFSILGNDFVPAEDFLEHPGETWTWVVTLMDDSSGRVDVLASVFIEPDGSSSNTAVAFANDTTDLQFSVDLHTAPPLYAIAGEADTSFDWSGATTEAGGQPLDASRTNRLLIGHIGGATLTDVEANVLTVLDTADELYYLDVIGDTEALLSEATERVSGANFSGFDTDGVWLVGIECTLQTCLSPAPLILTVVEAQ